MASENISKAQRVTDPEQIKKALIPASTGNGKANCIMVDDMTYTLKSILGVTDIPDFSTDASYSVGSFVNYSRKLYRITAAKSPGSWDTGKVIETSLYNELMRMYGSDTEQLTIVVSMSDESSPAGVSVGITMSDGRSYSSVTDSAGEAQFSIPRGSNYTIEFTDKEGYQHVPSISLISNTNARTIPVIYHSLASDAAYEYVTLVACRENYSEFTSVAGKTATISCSDGSVFTPVFSSKGSATQAVPRGVTYTVSWPSVENYLTPSQIVGLSASMGSRIIVCEPYMYAGDAGITIVDADGNEYSVESWVASGKSSAAAIHVQYADLNGRSSVKRDDGTAYGLDYYISVNIAAKSKQWCNQQVLFSSLQNFTNHSQAVTDKDGLDNTGRIISEAASRGLTVQAATWCTEQSLTIGGKQGKPFFASYGQLWAWREQYDTVATALNKAGGSVKVLNIKIGRWWSSTQFSVTNAVHVGNGSFNNTDKTNSNSLVPLFAF